MRSAIRFPIEVVLNGVDLNEFAPAGERLDLDALAGMRNARMTLCASVSL